MLQLYLSMIDDPDDKHKFRIIYDNHRNLIFSVAMSVVRNYHTAEDIVQESFIKIAKNIKEIAEIDGKKAETYFVVLTRNTAIDYLRQNKKYINAISIDIENDDEDNDNDNMVLAIPTDFLQELITKEGFGVLVGLLDKLSPALKDTLKLKFVFEWTNGRIANFLGVEKKTVETRIYRGKKQMIELLKQEGYFYEYSKQ